MKYIIVGRTMSGKSELAKRLVALGLKRLTTYTTRPMRESDKPDDYKFIDESEVGNYNDRVLETKLNGFTYFARLSDIENADVMVLEPEGCDEIIKALPDTGFYVVYMHPADEKKRRRMAELRKDDMKVFESRALSENGRFAKFEYDWQKGVLWPDRPVYIKWVENDFEPKTVQDQAVLLTARHRQLRNFTEILNQMVDLECVQADADRKVTMTTTPLDPEAENAKPGTIQVSVEHMAMLLLDNDAAVAELMRSWWTHELSIKLPAELMPKPVLNVDMTGVTPGDGK